MTIDSQLIFISNKLTANQLVVVDEFIPLTEVSKFKRYFINLQKQNKIKTAGIGKANQYVQNIAIRGDSIAWLSSDETRAISTLFFEKFEQLIQHLNRRFYLGINTYEAHLACYPIGSFYQKHLDVFKTNSDRKVTFILYLNENWKKGDGGELRIRASSTQQIEPLAGRLVLFYSDAIEHEVLITHQPRYSLTGWFKSSINTLIDK